MAGGEMTMANVIAGAEDFNTRYGSLVGWQEAVRRVKPIPRAAAQFDLSALITSAGAKTAADAVDHLVLRLLRVPLDGAVRATLIGFLENQLGTSDLALASTYMERPLRLLEVVDVAPLIRRRLPKSFLRRATAEEREKLLLRLPHALDDLRSRLRAMRVQQLHVLVPPQRDVFANHHPLRSCAPVARQSFFVLGLRPLIA